MIIQENRINGFLVVRLPEKNRDPAGRGVYSSTPPCINGICYSGIDRMAWFDVDEDIFDNTLPPDIQRTRMLIEEASYDFTGIELCTDLTDALTLLCYSNRLSVKNELIAIYSEQLDGIKGHFEYTQTSITWLGYDTVSVGWWSLLREGLFVVPTAFPGWKDLLNRDGLFSSQDLTMRYAQAYEEQVQKGAVEELPDRMYEIEGIAIGRVHI
jgi:hypothetical protein